ncbi:sugar transferase [Lentisphaera profundi]|uniref:Sugar transferase n=1 Tax=Lentisphaera profundi TaxID=1658616 RepID=A0ABY7VWC7_9BACT|nr:sugar transferase [Lentisphaera profundi]WDE98540.1 sugar transferase [Lentisphaera profundi]
MQLTKVIFDHHDHHDHHDHRNNIKQTTYSIIKRLIDIVFSTLAILILSPVLIGTALIIKLTSSGAILFWQKRAGLKGKTMMFPKFRSMYADAEERKAALMDQNDHGDSITFKMKKDPRITPIGRYIRKLSIDELPQFFLVLKGDLSLVGPRPATLDEVAQYSFFENRRLSVKPGLTCIWQVSGRGDIPFKEQVFMDYTYIAECNIFLDIKLMALTIPAVLSCKGAY